MHGRFGSDPNNPRSRQSYESGRVEPYGLHIADWPTGPIHLKPPRGPLKRGWAWLLSHPLWTGVSAIAAVVAVVVAFVVPMIFDNDVAAVPAPEIDVSDCSANGNNISIDCSQVINLPKPASIADVGLEVSWEGYVQWFFDGPLSDLPTPPPYPADHKMSHCADWESRSCRIQVSMV